MMWIFDPKIFNYIIMVLYVVNAVRWSFYGSWGDSCYWLSAAAITASVTWGFQR